MTSTYYSDLGHRVLLQSADPRQYHMLFTKIYEFLDDCLNEHPNPKATEAFKKSVPKMAIIRKSGTRPIAYEDHPVTYLEEVEGIEGLQFMERERVERRPLIISQITRNYHVPKLQAAELGPLGWKFMQKPRSSKRRPSAA
jgi:hypothetical protein